MARRKRNREPDTAEISTATHDGRGIADSAGKKVFVAGALPGERVRFQRRKFRRNFDEAELLEVLEASPDRVTARCAVYGRCGGCAMQHMSIGQQRAIKAASLRDNLARIGRVEPENWLAPIVGEPWNYRRRARLAVKDVAGKGRVLVGFRERHAPFITDMHRCEVLAQPVADLVDELSALIAALSIRARLPQIEVAIAQNATALVFRVLDPPSAADIDCLSAFGIQHDLRVYLQPGGLDSVTPLDADAAADPLCYTLPEFDVRIDFEPVDFVQVNAGINRQMVAVAVDQLRIDRTSAVLDLYCGVGNFSLPLARRAGQVVGIEGDASLVARARANARRNALGNAEFLVADLAAIDGSEAWLQRSWDAILLDPARAGAAEFAARAGRLEAGRIVYVSCHPGTLARDAATLVERAGYCLESAGIIDMFPHTAHVESIAVFRKR